MSEAEANALELVDLMLHFGLPDHATFLLTHAAQAERASAVGLESGLI